MDTTIVVALPAVDDRVFKISSEPVPHLTLIYMSNDGMDLESVVKYVQHAASQLSPFGLQVDYRGTLGADNADVLFFEKEYDFKRIASFRHHLLLNDSIRRAYDKADQFPEWTPHLTLGYPETPAKEDDSDYGIHYVQFDRIAVFGDNYEGPEFRLKYEDHAQEVAMSDTTAVQRGEEAVDALLHYGVKGMRWGYTTVDGRAVPTESRQKTSHLVRGPKDATVTQRKAGTYVKAKGGKRHTASDDAVRTQASRQIAKKSTTDALSNKELKDTIERMRLEQEFAKLDKKVSRKGGNFIVRLLQSPEGRATSKDLLKRASEAASAAS